MSIFLFDDFHQRSKKHNVTTGMTFTDDTYIKSYERFKATPLPLPDEISISFTEVFRDRKSVRDKKKNSITLQHVSSLLHYACGQIDMTVSDDTKRRATASAGARFPLEIYLLVLIPQTKLAPGLYHYRPDIHALEYLYEMREDEINGRNLFIQETAQIFQLAFFITAIFERTTTKYGERGYRYIMLEAGAISHTLQQVAAGLRLDSLIFGGTNDKNVECLLEIDGVSESLVSTVLVK